MTGSHNPLAPEHLPFFITAPGQTDMLFNAVVVFVVLCVVALGVIFFTIHSLPERIAHRTKKIQLDIVAVLCLLALFTHEHVFWVAALLLAFIDLPDFLTPVQRIATAVENLAGQEIAGEAPVGVSATETAKPLTAVADRAPGEAAVKAAERAEAHSIQKGSAHA
jgi:hypothetical protein